jgi:predicted nucleic acid-binding protein
MTFVDTWAWLAIAYAKDPYHAVASAQHRLFRRQKRRYVTTDYVLSETISALFRAVPFGMAKHFMTNLFQSVRAGRHRLEYVTPDQFHRAYDLRLRYHDKPDISLVDFTSMVVSRISASRKCSPVMGISGRSTSAFRSCRKAHLQALAAPRQEGSAPAYFCWPEGTVPKERAPSGFVTPGARRGDHLPRACPMAGREFRRPAGGRAWTRGTPCCGA